LGAALEARALSLLLAHIRLAAALHDAGVDVARIEVRLPLEDWKRVLRAAESEAGDLHYDGESDVVQIAGIRYSRIWPK